MQPRSSSNPGVGELLAHAEFVRRLARQLCAADPQGADDLVQDVWVAALEQPPRHRSRLASWLATVARNLLASRLRRPSTGQAAEGLDRPQDEDSDELDRAQVGEARSAVANAVQRLRDPYREVLILRFYDGLELVEIARRTERPLETVRTQLRRALVQLRAEVTGEPGARRGQRLIVLAALSEGERQTAPALRAWSAGALAAGVAVLLIGLGWLALRRSGADSTLEVAASPRATSEADAVLDVDRAPSAPEQRVAVATEALEPSSASVSPPRDPVSRLEVEVVDSTGAAVEGAEIHVFSAQGWHERSRTDERGRASVALREEEIGASVFPPRVACLFAAAEGRATLEEVAVDTARTRDAALKLSVGAKAGSLRALVVDPDGIAIDGVDVVFIPAGLPSGVLEEGAMRRVARHATVTDAEGRFELERLPAGDGWIHLRHPDLGIATLALAVEQGPSSERELRFTPGATVRGTLTDEGGAPRGGVVVHAHWRTPFSPPLEWFRTSTAADGSYALALPANTQVELWAMDSHEQELQAYQRFDLQSGAGAEWSAQLARFDPVCVRLVDLDGAPLANWAVSMRRTSGSLLEVASQTDAEGRARLVLPALPQGVLLLQVLGPLLGERSVPLQTFENIQPHPSHEHVLELDRERRGLGGLIARLSPSGWTPPADLKVELVRADDAASAFAPIDRELAFRAAGLPPGRYSVALSSGTRMLGFVAHEDVLAGRTLDLGTIELPAPAELDLALLSPAETYELLAAHSDGELRSCGGVQGGATAVLLPGSFVLRKLSKAGLPPQETGFEAASGQRLTFGADLVLQDG